MKRIVRVLVSLAPLGCHAGPAPADAPVSTPSGDASASREHAAEVLELSIPLFDGGSVELSRFRGRLVILELSASYAEGWGESHDHYRRLLEAHGEDTLSVITVSLDMDRGELASWERDPPPFVLGWDPQGALAARLGVTRLPTIFVLDREGEVLEEMAGVLDDFERLARLLPQM